MLGDPNFNGDSLRFLLRQIYIGPFFAYVVRNPWPPWTPGNEASTTNIFSNKLPLLYNVLNTVEFIVEVL
jgi:hypothetical protein